MKYHNNIMWPCPGSNPCFHGCRNAIWDAPSLPTTLPGRLDKSMLTFRAYIWLPIVSSVHMQGDFTQLNCKSVHILCTLTFGEKAAPTGISQFRQWVPIYLSSFRRQRELTSTPTGKIFVSKTFCYVIVVFVLPPKSRNRYFAGSTQPFPKNREFSNTVTLQISSSTLVFLQKRCRFCVVRSWEMVGVSNCREFNAKSENPFRSCLPRITCALPAQMCMRMKKVPK